MSKAFTVAKYTFKELLKSKVLFNVILIGVGLLVLSFVASEFTYGVPERIAIDFGLGTLTLSTVAIAILMGVGLVSNEIETRTIYMTLSRPLSRSAFMTGKVLGISIIFIANIFILASITLGFYLYLGGSLNSLIVWNLVYALIESLICLLLVVNFSLITNKTLSIIFTFALYLAGHGVTDSLIAKFQKLPALHFILSKYHYLMPGFSRLNIKGFVLYKQTLEVNYLIGTLGYGVCYLFALIVLACLLFENKNLD